MSAGFGGNGAEAGTINRIGEESRWDNDKPLLAELRKNGVATRRRLLATGRVIGGIPFGRGALGHLLKNRTYLGELNHRSLSYAAEHLPIVDRAVFQAVQAKLAENLAVDQSRRTSSEALLIGRIYDDRGIRMTPTHSNKNGVRYRYYTSRALSEGRKDEAGSLTRVPAPEIEALILEAIRSSDVQSSVEQQETGSVASEPAQNTDTPMPDDRVLVAAAVDHVVIRTGSVDIHLNERDVAGRAAEPISIPWVKPTSHRRRQVIAPLHGGVDQRVIRADAQAALVEAIVRARRWLDEIVTGKAANADAIAEREGRTERSIRMTLSLAFLAPNIIRAIVEGTLPRGVGLSRLADLPPAWAEQQAQLGLDRRTLATMGVD